MLRAPPMGQADFHDAATRGGSVLRLRNPLISLRSRGISTQPSMSPLSKSAFLAALSALLLTATPNAFAQAAPAGGGAGSLVDDKKAKALLDAGDARFDAGELTAAIDLY